MVSLPWPRGQGDRLGGSTSKPLCDPGRNLSSVSLFFPKEKGFIGIFCKSLSTSTILWLFPVHLKCFMLVLGRCSCIPILHSPVGEECKCVEKVRCKSQPKKKKKNSELLFQGNQRIFYTSIHFPSLNSFWGHNKQTPPSTERKSYREKKKFV